MNETSIAKTMEVLDEAEYLLLGGGAGLSAAAGLYMDGEKFERNFSEFINKFGIHDLYSGGFYPYPTLEEKWAFWAKHIYHSRYEIEDLPLYHTLHDIVKDKKYFVITTNVDGLFVKSGFSRDKVFEVQGDYGYFQCSKPCHNKLYDNEKQVKKMVTQIADCRIPAKLIPRCPKCGEPMDYNLRVDNRFVQDETWYQHQNEYQDFLQEADGKKIVLLELGVGFNTPAIIRFPFERIVNQNEKSWLIRFNKDFPKGLNGNIKNMICFSDDLADILNEIARRKKA